MIHAIVADARTVRVFEGSPPLRALLESRSNESVVLVAAPRMLAHVRKALPAAVSKRVTGELRLDLAHQPLGALKTRLQPALHAAAIKAVRASHG